MYKAKLVSTDPASSTVEKIDVKKENTDEDVKDDGDVPMDG